MLPRALSLLLGLAVLWPAVAARAEEPTHAADTQRAKELFQQGTTLFNLGEFDKAIEAWQEGYKAKPDPGFLYNIGQAYRLKGDPAKAIFFYRGYLRNSPKAANRAEIETKIAALQKDLNEPKAAPVVPSPVAPPPVAPPPAATEPVAPAPRVVPPPPVAPSPVPVAPPPAATPPLAGAAPVPVPEPAPLAEEPPPGPDLRSWDVGLGFGFDKFTSGLNIKGSAPAQFAFDLGAGFTPGGNVYGPASFRVGALLNVTSVTEGAGATANKLSFTSVLAEPSVRIRLVDRRVYLTGGLGLGVLVVGGVKKTSVVVDPKTAANPATTINPGGISTFELRPAVGIQVHVARALVLYASPALSFAAKPKAFYESFGRFELMFGVTALF